MSELLPRLQSALADRYLVQHEIGAGGMGTVFLAQDLKLTRPVAIKVLNPEIGASLATERFLREIQIAARLQHPHIVPLYDSGVADDLLFYVMPHIEGESLRERLAQQRQLPVDTALRIADESADALEFAHRSGVIHRDIKPGNILLSGGHALVADFGVAFAVTEAGGETLTRTGVAVGTSGYMSPEQATGTHEMDARTDIYSLGCVLYEMLAGLPPYVGPTPISILAQQAAGDLTPPRKIRAEIPRTIERAVLRALATDPADRPATADEFSRALAQPSGAIGIGGRRVGVRNLMIAAAAIVVIAVAGSLIGNGDEASTPGALPESGLQAFQEGRDLHSRALATGQPQDFENAIARFQRAAALDTTLIAPAMLWSAWSNVNLGQLMEADLLLLMVTPRRDRLSLDDLLMLDLLVSSRLRGDRASALRAARQTGGIDHPVQALWANRPREAIRALEAMDPGTWDDYWVFLTASYHVLSDHEGEFLVAQRARQDAPDRLSRLQLEVRSLAALGRVDEVEERLDASLSLLPDNSWWVGSPARLMSVTAAELRAHGNRAAALRTAERAVRWLEALPPAQAATRPHREELARAYTLADRWSDAHAVYLELAAERPAEPSYRAALGALAARLGNREEAESLSAVLVGQADRYRFGIEPYWQAGIAALLGDRERAVSLLAGAIRQGFYDDPYGIHTDMDLEPLWDYEPYEELVRPKG